jgi:hypothetical protein
MKSTLSKFGQAARLTAKERSAISGGIIITRYICAYDCVIYGSLSTCRANCPFSSCFRGTLCP